MVLNGGSIEESFNLPSIRKRNHIFYNIQHYAYAEASLDRYEMVWSETTRFYNEMIRSSKVPWPTKAGQSISFTQSLDFTHRLALCVILSCGFGLPLTWDERAYVEAEGSSVSLDDGIRVQGDNLILVSFAPKWILSLPFDKYVHLVHLDAGWLTGFLVFDA